MRGSATGERHQQEEEEVTHTRRRLDFEEDEVDRRSAYGVDGAVYAGTLDTAPLAAAGEDNSHAAAPRERRRRRSRIPLSRRLVARISLFFRKLKSASYQYTMTNGGIAVGANRQSFVNYVLGLFVVTSNKGGYAENLLALTYTLSWMCVSSGLVMLNKYILSSLKFAYPLTLCSLGMLFSGIVSGILFKGFGIGRDRDKSAPRLSAAFESDDMGWMEYCRTILPIGLASSMTLYWGNYAYLYLSVSFIQMLKAFTPVVTMVVLFLFGMETFRAKLLLSVFAMTAGTALASFGEVDFNLVGFLSMAVSETCEALKLVAMQYLLAGGSGASSNTGKQRRKFGLFEGLYHFAPATFFWLFLGIAFTEGPRLLREGGLRIMSDNALIFMLASSMGFGVNLLTLGVVKMTSSLTYKVVGQVKNAFTVYFSVIVFGNPVTGLQVLGYGSAIAGFLWYNKQKLDSKKANDSGQDASIAHAPRLKSNGSASPAPLEKI